MSIDAGDVVKCIDNDPCPRFGPVALRIGALYRVTQAQRCARGGEETVALRLDRHNPPPNVYYDVSRFRKIDASDEAFARQIRNCRPIGVRL